MLGSHQQQAQKRLRKLAFGILTQKPERAITETKVAQLLNVQRPVLPNDIYNAHKYDQLFEPMILDSAGALQFLAHEELHSAERSESLCVLV